MRKKKLLRAVQKALEDSSFDAEEILRIDIEIINFKFTIMRKILFVLLLLFTITTYSQNSNISEITSNADARFEIIQSPVARIFTIKIDKQTGDTWQMVLDNDYNLSWEKLHKGLTLEDDKKIDGKNNYIIFMGGTAVKDMFMMNVNTGTCWQLVKDSLDGSNWWSPMKTTY